MSTLASVRALIIEDNNDDAQLLLYVLKKGGFLVDSIRVDTKPELLDALKQDWDIVFSDYSMPNLNGFEALRLVREVDPDVPYIYVSGTIGEDRAVEAVRLGAQDYFIKGDLKRLSTAVTRELKDSVSRRNHRLSQERIHFLANYDALTGLPNRHLFKELLSQHNAGTKSQSSCLFILNLDRFRNVNDHLGTAAGDELLIELAKRLRELLDDDDVVARLSADEFAILVANLNDTVEASTMAEKILSVLTRPFLLTKYEWRMNASMGCTLISTDNATSGDPMGNAMMALHHAQQTAGTHFLFYCEDMRLQLHKKVQLTRDLEQAVEHEQFQLHYQPQILVSTGGIVGTEALIRWQTPNKAPISPGYFIPIAEESGLIVPIGEWTLREACRQILEWRGKQLDSPQRVAVNVSAFQFHQRDLVKTICSVLEEFALPAPCLEIEITESALMQDAGRARDILSQLSDLGISIALDDFGTGYSSLSYLKQFPVDIIKIDQSFVRDLPHDQDDVAIVRAIIAMAEKLNMQVIAEGVESAEQLAFLKEAGCDLVQGYYFQKPAAAADLLPMLEGTR